MKRKRGFMETPLAQRILDEIAETGLTRRVFFHLMGEPFLHPDAIEIIQYARSKGLEAAINTNCSLFGNESLVNGLYESDVSSAVFSLQTPTRETYRLRRAGMDFDTYVSLVRKGVEKKFEKKSGMEIDIDLIHIENASQIDLRRDIVMNVTEKDAHEFLSDWVEFARNLEKRYSLPSRQHNVSHLTRSYMQGELDTEILPGVRISSKRIGNYGNALTECKVVFPAFVGTCFGLIDELGILWNGDCVFCCVDFDGRTAFGNLKEQSLAEIWTGPVASRARRQMKNPLQGHPFCRLCYGGTSARTWLTRQIGSILQFKLGFRSERNYSRDSSDYPRPY